MTVLTEEQKPLVNFACKVCFERHKDVYKYEPINCAFKEFDNEYCPYVLQALKEVKQ